MPVTHASPVAAYVNQWAAPATWAGLASFMLGTNRLNESFHTIFQDPHASTGTKIKAALVGGATIVTDVVTIGSALVGAPEVGEEARAGEEALLAADATEEATVAASDAVDNAKAVADTGGGVAADAGLPSETYYRTMSEANFEELKVTGRVPATRETFISPSEAYSLGYKGTTVRFTVQGGTQDALAGVGVRDTSDVAAAAYPDMPLVSRGWTSTAAFFKGEGKILNIGLGRGPALDIFNDAIESFEVAP